MQEQLELIYYWKKAPLICHVNPLSKGAMEHYTKGRNEEEELNSADIPLTGIPQGHGWMLITGRTRSEALNFYKDYLWKILLWYSKINPSGQLFTCYRLQTAIGPACTLIKEEGTLGVKAEFF